MLIQNTILGLAPMRTSLLLLGGVLTILFTVMKPEASQGLTFFPRLIYWVLQIGSGLLGIVLASFIIRLISSRKFPLIALVGITGIVGALISAPAFTLIDVVFPGLEEVDEDWFDDFAQRGWWQAVVGEFIGVTPSFLVCWYVVNMPLFFNTTSLNQPPPPEDPDEDDVNGVERKRQASIDAFYESLPPVVGRDIVAISSDLHYLNVYTTLGKTIVLGSLAPLADAFDDAGIHVHRSHWVSKVHVERIHIAGNTASCLMSNGMQIPISRSKRKLVKDYFGQSKLMKQQTVVTPLRKTN